MKKHTKKHSKRVPSTRAGHRSRKATKEHRAGAPSPPRRAKKRHHHRCALCNHGAAHDRRQGCLHFDGKKFCSCKHRG